MINNFLIIFVIHRNFNKVGVRPEKKLNVEILMSKHKTMIRAAALEIHLLFCLCCYSISKFCLHYFHQLFQLHLNLAISKADKYLFQVRKVRGHVFVCKGYRFCLYWILEMFRQCCILLSSNQN